MFVLLPLLAIHALQVAEFTEAYENSIDRFRRIFSSVWTEVPKLAPSDETFLLTKSKSLWAEAQKANVDPLKNPETRGEKADGKLLIRYWVAKDLDRIRECYEFYHALKLEDETESGPRFSLGFNLSQETYNLTTQVSLLDDALRKEKPPARLRAR